MESTCIVEYDFVESISFVEIPRELYMDTIIENGEMTHIQKPDFHPLFDLILIYLIDLLEFGITR